MLISLARLLSRLGFGASSGQANALAEKAASLPSLLSHWSLGGEGSGAIQSVRPDGTLVVRHEMGDPVALYQDIRLAGPTDPSCYLLKVKVNSTVRNSVTVAAVNAGRWRTSEGNLSTEDRETLGIRFDGQGGDVIRAHVWVGKGAEVEVDAGLIELAAASEFRRPSTFPPLLTTRPDYMTEAEWAEFQAAFAEDPAEGSAYLNELEIRKSVEFCHSWPRVLQFSLSSYCNIACRFCAQTKYAGMFNNPEFVIDDFTVEKMASMFDDVEFGYPYYVDFSGDGEPLVHPDFIGLLEYARTKFPFSRLRTCSNGLALTQEISRKIVEFELDWLNVSLNAATQRSWEITTGNRHFDRVIDNIRYLQELKRATGRTKPTLGMTYVLTRHSLEDLPAFVDLCVELGVDCAAVHHMTLVYSEFVPDSVTFTKRRANEVLRQVRDKANRLGFHISLPTLFKDDEHSEPLPPPTVDFDFALQRKEYLEAFNAAKRREPKERAGAPVDLLARSTKETVDALRCRYAWDYLKITGDGITRVCCGSLPEEPGSMFKDGFWKLWNGEMRRYIRRTVNTARIDEECYFCPLNATRDVDELETHMRPGPRAQSTEEKDHHIPA
jgi:MoaA/NifB/PqqE/SkfB family radical SAM enzyme